MGMSKHLKLKIKSVKEEEEEVVKKKRNMEKKKQVSRLLNRKFFIVLDLDDYKKWFIKNEGKIQ